MAGYILLVEDDTILQKAFELKCAKKSIPITIIGDGGEALAFIDKNQEKPAVVILDLMLPTTSGFEVLEKIRGSKTWRTVPVIVLSVLGQDDDRAKAQACGIDEYLIKSDIRIDDVIQKFEFYLERNNKVEH